MQSYNGSDSCRQSYRLNDNHRERSNYNLYDGLQNNTNLRDLCSESNVYGVEIIYWKNLSWIYNSLDNYQENNSCYFYDPFNYNVNLRTLCSSSNLYSENIAFLRNLARLYVIMITIRRFTVVMMNTKKIGSATCTTFLRTTNLSIYGLIIMTLIQTSLIPSLFPQHRESQVR